jgi:hypothetical protein
VLSLCDGETLPTRFEDTRLRAAESVLEMINNRVVEELSYRAVEHVVPLVPALLDMAFQRRRVQRFEQFKTTE